MKIRYFKIDDSGKEIPGTNRETETYDSILEFIDWGSFEKDSVYAVYTNGKFEGFHYTMPYMDGRKRAYQFLEDIK